MEMEAGGAAAAAHFNSSSSSNHSSLKLKVKTKLCRRFCRLGVCVLGSKCNYAHGIADLRRSSSSSLFRFQFQQPPPKLCRMFAYNNKQCTYGHNCRFLHSTPPPPPLIHHSPPPPPPPAQLGKFDCYLVKTCGTPATTTTNASTSTMATTSNLHKNGPYGSVKCMFKKNDFLKISRIYADWI